MGGGGGAPAPGTGSTRPPPRSPCRPPGAAGEGSSGISPRRERGALPCCRAAVQPCAVPAASPRSPLPQFLLPHPPRRGRGTRGSGRGVGGGQRRPPALSGRAADPAALAPLPPAAVVGAGLGGSAVAYFLQQHFGPQVQLDVYEPAGVGGRLATVTVNKQQYESRGASIHALSLHMLDFVKILGERRHPKRLEGLPILRRGGWGAPRAVRLGQRGGLLPVHLGTPGVRSPSCCPCAPALLSPGRERDGVAQQIIRARGPGGIGGGGGVHKLPPVCPSRQQQLHGMPQHIESP